MKREDITRIFAEATEEQIKSLLNINSADITHALGKQKNELTEAQTALESARGTISELEKSKGLTEKLQAEIEKFRQSEQAREAAEKQAAAQAKLTERLENALGGRKFSSDFARKGVLEAFGKALQEESNVGKSDAEIFTALTKDQNVFASQNPAAPNMPGFNPHVGGDDLDALSDADYYARVLKK